jgi:hypothetical protein
VQLEFRFRVVSLAAGALGPLAALPYIRHCQRQPGVHGGEGCGISRGQGLGFRVLGFRDLSRLQLGV